MTRSLHRSGLPGLAAVVLSCAMVGCGSDDAPIVTPTPIPQADFHGNNDSALLVLDKPAGAKKTANSLLSKAVPLTLIEPSDGFSFGQAYIVRSSTAIEHGTLICTIRNDAAAGRGFIGVQNIAFKNSSGATLAVKAEDSIHGSVGAHSGSDCLAPGETGYLLIPTDVNWSDVAAVEIASVSWAGKGQTLLVPAVPSDPAARVIPQNARFSREWLSKFMYRDWITVDIVNQGTVSAAVSRFCLFILFDDAGAPVDWGYADDLTPSGGSLPAGATGSLREAGVTFFDGTATKVLVIADFE